MKQNNVLGLEFVVVRDYSDRAPGLGTVTCAEFRDKEDALEYFRWQQRRWKDEAKKYGERVGTVGGNQQCGKMSIKIPAMQLRTT